MKTTKQTIQRPEINEMSALVADVIANGCFGVDARIRTRFACNANRNWRQHKKVSKRLEPQVKELTRVLCEVSRCYHHDGYNEWMWRQGIHHHSPYGMKIFQSWYRKGGDARVGEDAIYEEVAYSW